MTLLALALAATTLLAGAPKKAPPPPAAPAAPAAPATADEGAESSGRRRTVVLTPERLAKPIAVKAAPNVATNLSFPEPWAATPSCGDCVVGGQPQEGQPNTLWRIDIVEATNTIVLKPIAYPGPTLPPTAFEASLDVTLVGGVAVTLFLSLAEVPANADLRIDFKLPEGADAASKKTALERELRADYDARVAEAVKEAMADTMMQPTKCKEFFGGPRRKDDLITRLRQMCRNGSYVYVVFEVENGGSKDLSLASATLSEKSAGDGDFFRFKKQRLLFRERTLGFAALPSVDPNAPASTYVLSIVEDGGSDRTLVIDGIDF